MSLQSNKICTNLILSIALLIYPVLAQAEDESQSLREEVQSSTEQEQGGVGDLLVTPTRIVFSGRTRSAEVLLKNRGNTSTTYRISFMDLGVNDKGEYNEVENYDKSAKDFIRYSPRQVTLEPGGLQKVKLLLRKPSDLADGEYRTHMKFQALPGPGFGEDVEATAVTDQVSVRLIPLVGVSIPVIVQKGALKGHVAMHAIRKANKVQITLERRGARSLLGDIVVKQDSKVLTTVNASVLMPAKSKSFSVELPQDAGSSLTAEYVELQGDSAKPVASVSF